MGPGVLRAGSQGPVGEQGAFYVPVLCSLCTCTVHVWVACCAVPCLPGGLTRVTKSSSHPSPLGPRHTFSSGADQMGFSISMCPPHLLSDGKAVTSTWAQGEERGAAALEGVKMQMPPRSRQWTEAVILKLGGHQLRVGLPGSPEIAVISLPHPEHPPVGPRGFLVAPIGL